MTTLIRGGLVHDAVHRDACKADILLADGKIAAIGTDLTARTPWFSTPTALMYSPAFGRGRGRRHHERLPLRGHDRGEGRIYRRRAGCGITPLAK